METINIHDAKTQFSRLVDEPSTGKEIVIAKADRPDGALGSPKPGRAPLWRPPGESPDS